MRATGEPELLNVWKETKLDYLFRKKVTQTIKLAHIELWPEKTREGEMT